MKRKN